jgi:hypothetical protein
LLTNSSFTGKLPASENQFDKANLVKSTSARQLTKDFRKNKVEVLLYRFVLVGFFVDNNSKMIPKHEKRFVGQEKRYVRHNLQIVSDLGIFICNKEKK